VTCDDFRKQLTPYLDGELEDDRGSALRGHLRGCQACRDAARDFAALRDGLRALPPLDPPPSLWTNVQAQLAAAEVADAERPAWRRAIARWLPTAPRLGLAAAAMAAAVLLLVWHGRRHAHEDIAVAPPPTPVQVQKAAPAPTDRTDVTEALAADGTDETRSYAAAAAELQKLAGDARARWTDDRKQMFDARVAALHRQIDGATSERARQHGYRALIRYLQGAAVRDEVAVGDRTFAGGMR